MRRIRVDLNRRTPGGLTPVTYVGTPLVRGQRIIAFEPEDGVRLDGVVDSVDLDRSVALLALDWDSIRDDTLDSLVSRTGGRPLSSTNAGTGGSGRGWGVQVDVPIGLPVAV